MAFPDHYPMLSSVPQQQLPPSQQQQLQRKLSSRRSSSAAQDPFGRLALTSTTPIAESVSRLTIVRVPSTRERGPGGDSALDDGYTSGSSRPGSALGSRPGSVTGNHRDRDSGSEGRGRSRDSAREPRDGPGPAGMVRRSSWGSERAAGGGVPGRMTFAFSSFTPIHPPGSASPGSSPQSGTSPAQPTNTSGHQPTLSTSSAGSAGGGTGFAGSFSGTRARAHSGASLHRPLTPSVLGDGRPHVSLTPQQTVDLALSTTSAPASSLPTPIDDTAEETAAIAELPQEDYLPFLSRPTEVAELISSPGPTRELFRLLSQTFPPRSPSTSHLSRESTDPAKWTYAQLVQHLTTVDRPQCPDMEWTRLARICVRARSEALWERVKGALGIPPELELEDPRDDPSAAWKIYDFGEMDVGEEDGEEEGVVEEVREAYLEPVYPGDHSPLLSPTIGVALSPQMSGLSASMSMAMPDIGERIEEEDEDAVEEEDEEEEEDEADLSDAYADADALSGRSDSPAPSSRSGASSSLPIHGLRITTHTPFSPSTSAPHTPGVGGLSSATPAGAALMAGPGSKGANLTRAFSTGSIRAGLARLKMTPMSPPQGPVGADPSVRAARLSVPAGVRDGATSSGSTSATASPVPTPRPRGATVSAREMRAARPSGVGLGLQGRERDVMERERIERLLQQREEGATYNPLAERGPGNPLFPSSFSRLSMSPTLSANNPALRNPPSPHPSAYQASGRGRHSRVPSWAEGMMQENGEEYEYAVTVASGSSDYGGF